LLIKIGTDICSVRRIAAVYERYSIRFLEKIMTEQERFYVLSQPPHTVARIAARFAAKEAAAKTLGTGWNGVGWKEIEIVRKSSGEPGILLHGRAIDIAKKRGLTRWEVSLSHERDFATASVLAYGDDDAALKD
jgi:holo-[acyl-carrier protein] synthase